MKILKENERCYYDQTLRKLQAISHEMLIFYFLSLFNTKDH